MRYSSLTLSEQLPDRLEALIQKLHQTERMTSERACHYLEKANIPVEALLPWANFEHAVEQSYGRQLLYSGGNFDVLLISWAGGDWTAIHDHGVTLWGAIQCFGPAQHVVYQYRDQVLNTIAVEPLIPNAVNPFTPGLIHQMGNPGSQGFMSLHIYGRHPGPLGQHPTHTGSKSARVFDLFEETIQHTERGAFFCLAESDITQRNYGLRGDLTATLHHHECMLQRVSQILRAKGHCLQLRDQADRLRERIFLLRSHEVELLHPAGSCA
jgi:hypothetical protein